MIKNDSKAMQTGQQMKGMDMEQQMKGMDMEQMVMPPHYSKSTYHLISSFKGMQISGLDILNDKELLVKIKSVSSDPVNQNLTLVGGGGDLAGSASVKAGWKDNILSKSEVTRQRITLDCRNYTFTSILLTKKNKVLFSLKISDV